MAIQNGSVHRLEAVLKLQWRFIYDLFLSTKDKREIAGVIRSEESEVICSASMTYKKNQKIIYPERHAFLGDLLTRIIWGFNMSSNTEGAT